MSSFLPPLPARHFRRASSLQETSAENAADIKHHCDIALERAGACKQFMQRYLTPIVDPASGKIRECMSALLASCLLPTIDSNGLHMDDLLEPGTADERPPLATLHLMALRFLPENLVRQQATCLHELQHPSPEIYALRLCRIGDLFWTETQPDAHTPAKRQAVQLAHLEACGFFTPDQALIEEALANSTPLARAAWVNAQNPHTARARDTAHQQGPLKAPLPQTLPPLLSRTEKNTAAPSQAAQVALTTLTTLTAQTAAKTSRSLSIKKPGLASALKKWWCKLVKTSPRETTANTASPRPVIRHFPYRLTPGPDKRLCLDPTVLHAALASETAFPKVVNEICAITKVPQKGGRPVIPLTRGRQLTPQMSHEIKTGQREYEQLFLSYFKGEQLDGNTVLMEAAAQGNAKAVDIILRHAELLGNEYMLSGGSRADGKNALQLALENDHPAVVASLLKVRAFWGKSPQLTSVPAYKKRPPTMLQRSISDPGNLQTSSSAIRPRTFSAVQMQVAEKQEPPPKPSWVYVTEL